MTNSGLDLRKHVAFAVQRDMLTHACIIKSLFSNHKFIDRKTGWDSDPAAWLNTCLDTVIVFSNPYRDSKVLELYRLCRTRNHPYLVIERGPLPETLFIDSTGFLADSTAYEKHHVIEAKRGSQPTDFRDAYFNNKYALEVQDSASNSREQDPLTHGENTTKTKPIILITLQMPQDTSARYFQFDGRDYHAFLRWCETCIEQFSDKVIFKFKPHPRAQDIELLGLCWNTIANLSNLHIDDALVQCDLVVTFNSGTGVLGMMHHKPIAVFGRAFYRVADGVHEVENTDDLSAIIDELIAGNLKNDSDDFLLHLTGNVLSQVQYLPQSSNWTRRKIGFIAQQLRFYDGKNFIEVPNARHDNLFAMAQEYGSAFWRFVSNRLSKTAS